MKKNKTVQRIFSILLLAGLILSMAQPVTVTARTVEPQAPGVTVEPQVLEQMAANGAASYWIDLSSKADLSRAQRMDWSKRGWYVYGQLAKSAEASQAEVAAYLRKAGVRFKPFWIKNTILVESSNQSVLNGLNRFTGIAAIRARKQYQLHEPDRSGAALDNGVNAIEPNLTHINADDVWALGYTGTGMVVANIDTGVRYTHNALRNQYRGNQGGGVFDHNYNWFDPYGDFTAPADANGHGTHTMGTMVGDDGGANQIGVAPGADWMACRGCDTNDCTDQALLACAEFVAAPTDLAGQNPNPDLRPNAVNNSWGDCGLSYDDWYQTVVDAWQAAGVYPIFSNGNNSNCGYPAPPGLGTVGNPARYGNVTGVGSSGEQDGLYASHSNWGPSDVPDTINPVSGFAYMKPQVIAPGVSIRSSTPGSDNDYQDGWSGTSMSAPHVTGLVALMWQAGPCLVGDYAKTETLIENTAVPVIYDDGSPITSTNDPNFAAGWGEIDALAAVQAAAGFCGDSVLNGVVTDAATALPLAGAKVTITAQGDPGNNRSLLTGANGVYSASVFADTYDISAAKFGYGSKTVTGVVLNSGGTVTTNFGLDEQAAALVNGVVYDGGIEGGDAHGYPLYASLTFSADGFSRTVYTDPFTGAYEIELYLGQAYNVTVTAASEGYQPFSGLFTPDTNPKTQDYTLYVNQAACAAPGYQPDYTYFWDFETDDGGFTPAGTTSFAWGEFTSGPKKGHSGTKGLATNPAGNYNTFEDGNIISPVLDLTGFGAASPVLEWWDWKAIEDVGFDWARVDVSKDGGSNWTSVWGPVGSVFDTAYHKQTVVLDPSYNVANFRFRFFFRSDGMAQYAGWYIDDVGVSKINLPPAATAWSSNFDTDNGGFTVSGSNPSWEWGAPTLYGPGSPHSAPNVWATDLDFNYNNYEYSFLTSPVIDLSAYSGKTPTLSFWHWMAAVTDGTDWGEVQVSKDGGGSWTTVYEETSGHVTLWAYKAIQLDPSYAVSNFRFRFNMISNFMINNAGWYIDDVAVTVADDVPISASCGPIPGGAVAGFVRDGNLQEPLDGATVASDTGVLATTFANPDDPIAGFYWLFQPGAGAHSFTASKTGYGSDTKTVLVMADTVARQDFALSAGHLGFDPSSLEKTMTIGDAPASGSLTISNDGNAPAAVSIFEIEKGYVPLKIHADQNRKSAPGGAPPELTALGATEGKMGGAPVSAFPNADVDLILDDGSADNAVGIGGNWEFIFLNRFTPSPGSYPFTLKEIQVYFDSGTNVQVGDDMLLVVYENTSGNADPAVGANFRASFPVTVQAVASWNTYTLPAGVFLTGPGDVLIGVVALETSGSSYFPAAIDTDASQERSWVGWWSMTPPPDPPSLPPDGTWMLIDDAGFAGNWLIRGAGVTGGEDVVWLSVNPVDAAISGGGSQTFTVTFDPSSLSQPGDYKAELSIQHDTPYAYPNLPVTLHLQSPAGWGAFKGKVTGMERCDVNPAPLKDATVNIYAAGGALVATTTTGADGGYSWSLPAGEYDIEVIAVGFVGQKINHLTVTGGGTRTVDFNLRLEAPCLVVDPASLEKSLVADRTAQQMLKIYNIGAGAATFDLLETPSVTGAPLRLAPKTPSYGRQPELDLPGSDQSKTAPRTARHPGASPNLPLDVLISEGFEGAAFPPDNWTQVINNTNETWGRDDYDPHSGNYYANVLYDFDQDEWLLTPELALASGTLSVWSYGSVLWCRDTYDNCDLNVWLVVGEVGGGDDIFVANLDEDWTGTWAWSQSVLDLAPFLPGVPVRIGFQYLGNDGAEAAIDDIVLDGVEGLDVPWLSEDPLSGTIPADSNLNITVTFNSAGLALGDYRAMLLVRSPQNPTVNVPVLMHVVNKFVFYLPMAGKAP